MHSSKIALELQCNESANVLWRELFTFRYVYDANNIHTKTKLREE